MTALGGKTAFVTGGGGSIGGAIARALAVEGVRVAIADIRSETAREVAAEIEASGGTAVGVACDVCDRVSLEAARDEAAAALGPVSVLVAVAGATSWQRLTVMSDDDLDWIFQVNLIGVVNCMRAFVPGLPAGGHVVATASTAGLRPGFLPYHSAYSAAKLGVIGLMFNLRRELADAGIGSTLLIPAGVITKMGENNASYRPERFGGPVEGRVERPDAVKEIYAEHQRVFRPADEVAQMVLLAIRENRPIVVTDAYDRKIFLETYVQPLLMAFDEVEVFEEALGDQAGKRLPIEQMANLSYPPRP